MRSEGLSVDSEGGSAEKLEPTEEMERSMQREVEGLFELEEFDEPAPAFPSEIAQAMDPPKMARAADPPEIARAVDPPEIARAADSSG